jgi:hypothetical protein
MKKQSALKPVEEEMEKKNIKMRIADFELLIHSMVFLKKFGDVLAIILKGAQCTPVLSLSYIVILFKA